MSCYQEAESRDLYVKKSDGVSVYEGWCWPGSSSWIDFLNPSIRRWWAEQFSPDKYQVYMMVHVRLVGYDVFEASSPSHLRGLLSTCSLGMT